MIAKMVEYTQNTSRYWFLTTYGKEKAENLPFERVRVYLKQ